MAVFRSEGFGKKPGRMANGMNTARREAIWFLYVAAQQGCVFVAKTLAEGMTPVENHGQSIFHFIKAAAQAQYDKGGK